MSTTFSKRAREQKKAEKAREKAMRRDERRDREPAEPEIVSRASIVGEVRSTEEVLAELHTGGAVSRSAAPIPSKLFIGSLSDQTTSKSLEAHFSAEFSIDEAVVITDRGTGLSRNFGFVTVTDRRDAAAVIEAFDRSELDGREIAVRVATER